jgi:hypothetical protein
MEFISQNTDDGGPEKRTTARRGRRDRDPRAGLEAQEKVALRVPATAGNMPAGRKDGG